MWLASASNCLSQIPNCCCVAQVRSRQWTNSIIHDVLHTPALNIASIGHKGKTLAGNNKGYIACMTPLGGDSQHKIYRILIMDSLYNHSPNQEQPSSQVTWSETTDLEEFNILLTDFAWCLLTDLGLNYICKNHVLHHTTCWKWSFQKSITADYEETWNKSFLLWTLYRKTS